MDRTLEKGNVLLVCGPASVTLMDGRVTILGADLIRGNRVVVRKRRTAPFEAEEPSLLDVTLGVEANIEEVVGSTIPNCWRKMAEEILSWPRPFVIIVMGDVDCGKTSFCTFLANQVLRLNLKPAIIDADLGQADIGSPTTVGMSFISKPITDLFLVDFDTMFFTGITSPSDVTERLITGITSLKEKASSLAMDVIIINTDGWIQGEEAENYKIQLMKGVRPQAVVGIQQKDEVENILTRAEAMNVRTFRCASPPAVKKRDKDARKELREQGYRKFLDGAALKSIPITWMQFEYTPLGKGIPSETNRMEELEKAVGCRTIYCEETSKDAFVVLGDKENNVEENAVKVEEFFKKKAHVVREGDEKGLLVGLLDQDHQFLGLGMIDKIDYENKTVKIYTPCKEKVSIIQFGRMKLDEKGREIGINEMFYSDDHIPL